MIFDSQLTGQRHAHSLECAALQMRAEPGADGHICDRDANLPWRLIGNTVLVIDGQPQDNIAQTRLPTLARVQMHLDAAVGSSSTAPTTRMDK